VSFIPDVLERAAASIRRLPRIELSAPWTLRKHGRWSLGLRARLSVPASEAIDVETSWYLVFDPSDTSVTIFPAKVGGITKTFKHQSFNAAEIGNLPWRQGNPCLQRQAFVFGRTRWVDESNDVEEKILWFVERLLLWIDAAATDTLAIAGETFELPSGPGQASFPLIGFMGSEEELGFWAARTTEWGWADLVKLPRAASTYAVTSFRGIDREPIVEAKWGAFISSTSPSRLAIWIAVDSLPVIYPWELPRTWSSLRLRLASMGVDLQNIFVQAGAEQRRTSNYADGLTLLIGVPIAALIGGPPSRVHWLAIDNVPLAKAGSTRNGFRPMEKSRRLVDSVQAMSNAPLNWLRSSSWDSGELRTRAGKGNDIPAKKVLVIGAGSLGSAVSENLVRMGITNIGIMDADRVDIGNLTRHALGMDAVGHNKALALASALNLTMPDADAAGFATSFPPSDGETVDRIRQFDVIVDCSGSDVVLDALSDFDWGGEKLFVSLGVTWKAEGLLVFTASEASFPAIDAKERFNDFDTPPVDFDEAQIEGVGCWHPVFPADAADMRLWAAVGTKAIVRAIRSPKRRCEYFTQNPDGTVERQDV
jgi:hypothetical protein